MKKPLLNIILICVLALSIFNNTFKNTFIAPIGHLFINFQNGNFGSNMYLKEKGIVIKLQKHKWSYFIKKNIDGLKVNFYGPAYNNSIKDYQVDMQIFDDNVSNDLFAKIIQANTAECDKIIKNKNKKNNYLMHTTVCLYGKTGIIYWDIPSKKIMISYYPYTKNAKNQKIIKNFIDGIKILE